MYKNNFNQIHKINHKMINYFIRLTLIINFINLFKVLSTPLLIFNY